MRFPTRKPLKKDCQRPVASLSSLVAYRLRFRCRKPRVTVLANPPFAFSTHFHSPDKPITPLPTPSNLSTSLHLIRIRPSRSNESVSKIE